MLSVDTPSPALLTETTADDGATEGLAVTRDWKLGRKSGVMLGGCAVKKGRSQFDFSSTLFDIAII